MKKFSCLAMFLFMIISGSVYANYRYGYVTAEMTNYNLYINDAYQMNNFNWLTYQDRAYIPVSALSKLFNISVDWVEDNSFPTATHAIKIETEERITPSYRYRLSKEAAQKIASIILEDAFGEDVFEEKILLEVPETDSEYRFSLNDKVPQCDGGFLITIDKQNGRLVYFGPDLY